jgi:hypothetical protein
MSTYTTKSRSKTRQDALLHYFKRTTPSKSTPSKSSTSKSDIVLTENPASDNSSSNKKKERIGGKWSRKYKKSIDCKNPKGFSQKQYCKYGRNTKKSRK